MPRPLVFGNQDLLVAVDERHRIRDLIWPMDQGINHLLGKAVAWGIYADGGMSWIDDAEWQITLSYEEGALVGRCHLENSRLGLAIETIEACHPEDPIFIRKANIHNLRPEARTIKVFWNHEFLVGESAVGNTALYHPDLGGMVHYKRGHHLLAFCGESGPDEWSCGVRMKPADGSWSQCRGGKLDQKGREVGAVDSTMGLTLTLEPMGASEALWGLAAAGSLDGLAWLREEGLRSDVAGMRRAEDARFLTDKILVDDWEEFDRAVCLAGLVIRTQTSRGGAILAANDSDTMTHNTLNYTNVWPRDGALVAEALMDAGMGGPALDFVDWCTRVMPQDGLFEQKYQPDGSLGVGWHPLVRDGQRVRPIQLDETALCLSLAARVISRKSPEGQEEMRKKLVEPGLAALLEYRDDRGLPLPSWDLWEERRGVSFYSACTAARALGAWGRSSEAHAMSQGILKFMVGEDGAFVRQLKEDGSQDPDADSALVGGLLQGVFDWELPQVQATLDKVRSRLMDPLPRRDVARYEGDYYHRVADGYPGSPWILCTLWLGQAELRRGNREEGRRLIQTALDLASPTGILSESAHPLTAAPLSVSPLTWSHAEVLRAAAVWRDSAAQE